VSRSRREDSAPAAPPRTGQRAPEHVPADAHEDAEEGEERIRLTPGLVILGVLAVVLGLLSAVVMSAHTLAP
jgi:hypothetical protein